MKPRSLFFIDLAKERVFCVSCKHVCRSLPLEDCTLFWCASKDCDNSEEVRHYHGGRAWEVFSVEEVLGANSISEVKAQLILSIGA